jgi:serine/threonine-protein kinase HipA
MIMSAPKKINVSISLNGSERAVGVLLSEDRNIYFKYDSAFLDSGLEISPFKLRLSDTVFTGPSSPFQGLFGVFDDSLPDGWGRLLLDRALVSRGILPEEVTTLQRLSYVGESGMGALEYRPAIEAGDAQSSAIELDRIAGEMNQVLEGQSSGVIEELFQLGGSSGGARPKILVGYNSRTDHLIHGTHQLPNGYEHWLIKFPASSDQPDIAGIELAYSFMAAAAGIIMSPCRLFKGKSRRTYFGTKRFDRTPHGKLHMHSAAGLLHDNFRLSTLDYGHLMDCAFQLERSAEAYEKILRLAAFNVFTHNRDDHSKNVSFLMDEKGKWQLAPAYDLTFSNSSHGYHSTQVAGESRNPGTEHLKELAKVFRMKNAGRIIEEVKDAVARWKTFAQKAGVGKNSASLIGKRIGLLINK